MGEALDAAGARPEDVERFVHGMTVGTNALLEGRVARTALLATEGFTDIEELGRQAPRRALPALRRRIRRRWCPPSCGWRCPERTGPEGVLRELDEEPLRERARRGSSVEAAAVCLLWGFRHPEHEQRAAALVATCCPACTCRPRTRPPACSASTSAAPTTVVDAALSPLLRGYLERLAERRARRACRSPR